MAMMTVGTPRARVFVTLAEVTEFLRVVSQASNVETTPLYEDRRAAIKAAYNAAELLCTPVGPVVAKPEISTEGGK